ncbi:hypothetical protein [Paracoccus denitrificans]|jgi:hypothetical protein|uniref:Uncharacterized protein n=1 Tax=Paracoccus denitrificans (strain Pd 1222) TaxID=318586 RepID=A1B1J2_PARDP|nr:hypothetical protein [Paracoccus denitrificans]ABL69386.1 hypothetical protein Pden_1281 [Paracoccus denitrificans PD1222]MBB4629152.1 hypothetical protein [Paracoccus denitrificans]MCU7430109.1 hypothetical protein [Paracoccus denitrificans]QAR27376.1 hypothetical protein EO213_14345 [Paracoccus denitrificans]UFS64749.1 hypothetical protein LO749_11420 [Paracoccus denitrificans]
MRLLKVVVVLVILILAGLTGYAYFGDMSSDPREMRMPVELNLGAERPAPISATVQTAPTAAPEDSDAVQPAPAADGAEAGQNDLD